MSTPRHVLIVDGDERAAAQLSGALAECHGIHAATARGAEAGQAALSAVPPGTFDAAIVAAQLPDGDGLEWLRRLRTQGLREPLIVLSDEMSEEAAVRALDAGASDVMVRPILRVAELAARLRAHLRSVASADDPEVLIGAVRFRPSARTVRLPGRPVPVRLTEKEASLLRHLIAAAGRPVTRQDLLTKVWGYNPGASTHTVETHVYRLRRKIEVDAQAEPLVMNGPGGYRLNGLSACAAETAPVAIAPVAIAPPPAPTPAPTPAPAPVLKPVPAGLRPLAAMPLPAGVMPRLGQRVA